MSYPSNLNGFYLISQLLTTETTIEDGMESDMAQDYIYLIYIMML